MTNDGSHSYTYDAENRLIQVDGGSTASYIYDAVGQRVAKTVGGATTSYVYDLSGRVMAEFDSACSYCWGAGYTYLNGALVSIYAQCCGLTYFVHGDHLGSTRVVTGYPTPSVLGCYDYYPFGEMISCGGDVTTHKFTGKERDSESGLDNFGAREPLNKVVFRGWRWWRGGWKADRKPSARPFRFGSGPRRRFGRDRRHYFAVVHSNCLRT